MGFLLVVFCDHAAVARKAVAELGLHNILAEVLPRVSPAGWLLSAGAQGCIVQPPRYVPTNSGTVCCKVPGPAQPLPCDCCA